MKQIKSTITNERNKYVEVQRISYPRHTVNKIGKNPKLNILRH